MIKSKLKVIIISIILVLLLASIQFPFESYQQTLGIYILFGVPLLLYGAPVTFIAGLITRRMKRFPHVVNFFIHIIAAFYSWLMSCFYLIFSWLMTFHLFLNGSLYGL